FAEKPPAKRQLPIPRTPLLGREQQVAEASALLLKPEIQLLSLTGPGGSGKTRMALALAKHVAGNFPGGVGFVALATLRVPELVGSAVGDALYVLGVPHRSIPQLIADRLQGAGAFLLVLDNFEQVLPAATTLAEILETCPGLKLVVTSRASLHIYGEQEYPV